MTTEGDALADWDTLGDPLTVFDTDVEALIVFDTCGDLDTVTELEVKAEPDVVEVAARVPELTGDVLLVLHGEEDDDGHAVVEPVRDVDGDPDELRWADFVTLTTEGDTLAEAVVFGELLAVLDIDDEPLTELAAESVLETETDFEAKAEPEDVKVADRVPELTGDPLLVLHGDEDDDGHAVVEPVRDVVGDTDELVDSERDAVEEAVPRVVTVAFGDAVLERDDKIDQDALVEPELVLEPLLTALEEASMEKESVTLSKALERALSVAPGLS